MDNKRSKLLMQDISIEFPGVKALSNVDFEAVSGRIYALIGANGAGKSTLMKVLSGVNAHYIGKIFIDDQECRIQSPKAAIEKGIQIVYQEVDMALSPNLSVTENIMMNTLVNRMGKKQFVNWGNMHKQAQEQLRRMGIDINVHKNANELSLAEKQMVLIGRAILEKCKFLILDEPTAPLSKTETENLFKIVRRLAEKENVGIIFISHRLSELFEICEHITVMKDGKVVAKESITPELTVNKIVEHMLGRPVDEAYSRIEIKTGDTLLKIRDLTEQYDKVKNINLNVRKGEIVGIAGLVGAGKTELCKTLFGDFQIKKGEVSLNGKSVKVKNPTQAVKSGFALVPEERRKEGIIVEDPIYSNLTISTLGAFLNKVRLVSKSRQLKTSEKTIADLGIKTTGPKQKVALLSGGNQQKVVIGKWLVNDAKICIFDEPTKGVDVGAKRDIYKLIEQLAMDGKGIIYATCEFSEIMALTDRVYVMFDGEIVKELVTKETTENELLYYSTGGQ